LSELNIFDLIGFDLVIKT